MHDVRTDTNAMFHNHHVTVKNVLDLQVHYCMRQRPISKSGNAARAVKGDTADTVDRILATTTSYLAVGVRFSGIASMFGNLFHDRRRYNWHLPWQPYCKTKL